MRAGCVLPKDGCVRGSRFGSVGLLGARRDPDGASVVNEHNDKGGTNDGTPEFRGGGVEWKRKEWSHAAGP